MEVAPRHQCIIYEGSPARQLPPLAASVAKKLKANHRCLYLNSPPMVAGMRSYLAACGVDVAAAVDRGALVLSSSQDHLENGRFDVHSMLQMLRDSIESALADGYAGLWATGDMTWELGGPDQFDKLFEYEAGLEEIFRQTPHLAGVCQYHQDTLPPDAIKTALYMHPSVFISQTLSRLNPNYCSPAVLRHGDPNVTAARLTAMLNRLRHPDEV